MLPRLVECHTSSFHDLENFSLALIVESRTAVSILNIAAQIECTARKPSLDVAREGRWEAGVEVIGAGYCG